MRYASLLRCCALALALPVACDDLSPSDASSPGDEPVPMRDDDEASTGDVDDESSGSGSLEDDALACDAMRPLPELPYAFAVPEPDENGELGLRLFLTSEEATCGIALEPPPGHSHVSVRLPAGIDVGAFGLTELDAIAVMSADAPGNATSIKTLAFLHGTIAIDRVDGDRISGALCESAVPFEGTFDAVICP
jgi:hypothetical protein